MRVLDFGRYVAGPYCATLLGYLGAEVIRIEKREGGEDRYIAPIAARRRRRRVLPDGLQQAVADARSRRRRRAGKSCAGSCATADVVVANLPPASLRALGLDYASLKAVRADVILVTQTSFGDRGPLADRGGFDGVGQAMSGAMYMTGTARAPGESRCAVRRLLDGRAVGFRRHGGVACIARRRAKARK